MVTITTKPFGEIEVDEKQKLHFPEGILGFNAIKHFWLLEQKGSPFYWLQADDDATLAFLAIHPDSFMPDYELSILDEEYTAIGIENEKEDLLCLLIVTVPSNPADISANLLGPIIINLKTRMARQAISLNEAYTTNYKILSHMKEMGTTSGKQKQTGGKN